MSEERTWRSLSEASEHTESVDSASADNDGIIDAKSLLGRRGFMNLTGAAAASIGMAGCIRRPSENILPYAEQPEYVVPGVPLHFASVIERRGESLGVLVTSHDGRPTKIEGNPRHPSSIGGADAITQGALLDMYDPDRSTRPVEKDGADFETVAEAYRAYEDAIGARLTLHDRDQGRGLRVLHQPNHSPTFRRLRETFQARFPQASFHVYAPAADDNARQGSAIALSQAALPRYHFERAKVIVSIDSDFLMTESGSVSAARRFAEGRRVNNPSQDMNRLYVVEPTFSVTGSNADHRLRLPARQIGGYLKALAAELNTRDGVELGPVAGAVAGATIEGVDRKWIETLATDLTREAGASVIVVGERQPPWVHALGYAINAALRAPGSTVSYAPVLQEEPAQLESISELASAMGGGSVSTLLILGGNPVYDAPADLAFGDKLGQVEASFHLSDRFDETSALCTWHINRAHALETWGDHRSLGGTVSVQQPLIAPLFGGRSDIEVLGHAAGVRNWRGYYLIRETMRGAVRQGTNLERIWRRALHDGIVPGTTSPMSGGPPATPEDVAQAVRGASEPDSTGFEICFAPDPMLFDGRHANNLWLLELPDPMTKIVWQNVALMSPSTAADLGVSNGDRVRVARDGAQIELPGWIQPGHADGVVSLALGWGREKAGRYAAEHGVDVYPLRTTEAFWFGSGATVERVGERMFVAQTQEYDLMTDIAGFERPMAIHQTLDGYREQPDHAKFRAVDMAQGEGLDERGRPAPGAPLWQAFDYDGNHKWGMSIDLTSCIGCNACVIACQAENNIPVVGERHVARGREMHWLRIDRYFVDADTDTPHVAHQPIGCQQCEEAPCENVCPVNATAHTPEGLNDMSYNRCIGTRYCMNNCPYKVRRFNYMSWHNYVDDEFASYGEFPEVRKMAFNPNVTVRMRGVMEKCTYCVQRIQEAKIAARRDDSPIRDGSLQSACQQTCPTGAIVFGDLNGYPYRVRVGSALVGKSAPDIQQEFNLTNVRLERGGEVSSEPIQPGDVIYSASRLAELAERDRSYMLLAEVGARPRTTFLARIRNPNPEMVG